MEQPSKIKIRLLRRGKKGAKAISKEMQAKKRKRTETTEGDSQDEEGGLPAAKRAKGAVMSVAEKEAEIASALVASEPLNTKVITGIYLYTAGKREHLVYFFMPFPSKTLGSK